jgi:heat shock protein 4
VELDNKKLAFEVVQMGKKHNFAIEQIIAFYLVKLKKFYENA